MEASLRSLLGRHSTPVRAEIAARLSEQSRHLRFAPATPRPSDRMLDTLVARDSLIVSTVWNGSDMRSTCSGLPSHSRRTAKAHPRLLGMDCGKRLTTAAAVRDP